MQWQEACHNKHLQDLPYKIELNQQGQIIMTPVKVNHSLLQGKIIGLLYANFASGQALAECAIHTAQGTKVADVAWVSNTRLKVIEHETECSVAPEICIEVISASNTSEEMTLKKQLYFDKGAQEVWLCSEAGDIQFYSNHEQITQSTIAPNFPHKI